VKVETPIEPIGETPVETVVFDLGGVLIDWNPRYLYRKLLKDELEIESFLHNVCHSEWNEKQDAGRSFADGIAELIKKHPDKEALIRAYFDRWPEMLGGAIAGTVEILKEMKRAGKYRLFALSNWSAETFPIALQRYGFLQDFESILLSGQEKMLKPDLRFFDLLEARFKVNPTAALFIDDLEKNILGARRAGFKAIQFIDPQDLRQKLAIHKIELKNEAPK